MKESRSKAQKLQKFKPKIYDLNILKHSQTLSNKNSLLHSKNKLPSASNEIPQTRINIHTTRFKRKDSQTERNLLLLLLPFYHFYQIYRKGKKILESLILLTRDKRFTIQRDLLQSFEKKIPSQKTVYKLMFAEERLGPIARH